MFPISQILVTASAAAIICLPLLVIIRRRYGDPAPIDIVLLATVVGVSILFWRLAGNVASLNDDPIPLFSPNDVLCPIVTYVSLGIFAAFRMPAPTEQWPRIRAVLTLVSFVANVVLI